MNVIFLRKYEAFHFAIFQLYEYYYIFHILAFTFIIVTFA